MRIPTIIIIILQCILLNSAVTQNIWTQLPIPDTLKPTDINAEIPGYLYLTSSTATSASLYRSNDAGLTWRKISDSLLLFRPIGILNDSSLLMNGVFNLYRSDDYGNNWYFICDDLEGHFSFIKVDSEGSIFIGCGGGLIRSIDGGYSWDTLLISDIHHSFNDIEFGEPGQIFISSCRHMGPPYGGFYRSLDNGQTFEHIGLVNTYMTALERTSDNTLYASTSNGFFRSDDLGTSWSLFNDTLLGYPLIITPNDSIYAGIGVNFGLPIYLSIDLGTSWSEYSSGINSSAARRFSLSPDGHLYLFCNSWGSTVEIYSTFNPYVSISTTKSINNEIEVYPNPCIDYLYINLSNYWNIQGCIIQIFDMNGKLYYSKKINDDPEIIIETSDFLSGIYFIEFQNDKGTIIRKVVKQ